MTTNNHHITRLETLRQQVEGTDSCMAEVLDLAIGWATEVAPDGPNGLSKDIAGVMVGLVSHAWASGAIEAPQPVWVQSMPHLGDPKALANRVRIQDPVAV